MNEKKREGIVCSKELVRDRKQKRREIERESEKRN